MRRSRIVAALALLAAAAFGLAACSGSADEYQQAMTLRLQQAVGEKYACSPASIKVKYSQFERIDSTTFAEEFDMRETGLKLKVSMEISLYNKYLKEKKVSNATAKYEQIVKAQDALDKLYDLKDGMEDRLDEIAYYDYRFSAEISTPQGTVPASGFLACITPELVVLNYTRNEKDLHKGCGAAIPGWSGIFSPEEDE